MNKIIILSNNENSKELYEWLIKKGYDVLHFSEPIAIDLVKNFNPDLVISYNYIHIVKPDVIDYLENKIINLHTSFLPWNKGASPNIWSFIDNTPKGVTIHRLEKGLDTGKIIAQKELKFDEDKETLSSTYAALNKEIIQLLKDNWAMIEQGDYDLKEQSGIGSYHRKVDLNALLEGRRIDYSMTISEFKEFMKQ